MISFSNCNHYWSYYLAIESQLENISRYIEFSDSNQQTYSIELARILLSSSSEVDVLMKRLCKLIDPSSTASSINEYKDFIRLHCPGFTNEAVFINRFGLKMQPWSNWQSNTNPDWWTRYNKVKHHRDTEFCRANLKNAIHSVAALHILVVYYYKYDFSFRSNTAISFREVTRHLLPESPLMRLNNDYYYGYLLA